MLPDYMSKAPPRARPAHRQQHPLLATLVLLLALVVFAPSAAYAQSGTWLEQSTANFTIVYTSGNEAIVQEYTGFVDEIYEEIARAFDYRVETPLMLRLYPSYESYYEVNPAAREVTGIVAHADFRRREVAVIVSQTEAQTPEEVKNNIRHEMTHIVASQLSDNRLNTGFQEGIAQFMEVPTERTADKVLLLENAFQQGRLMNWSDFDSRESVYASPEWSYPQTLSVVTFLVDTYGFDQLRAFIVNTAQSNGYRSALEATYNIPASDLENQWRAWLPSYLDGSYITEDTPPPGVGYDLTYARQLLEAGRYAEARTELESMIELLATSPQQDVLAEAETLLIESRTGQEADRLATEARRALEAGDYETARNRASEARTAYEALGNTRQVEVLTAYIERAERGMRADQQLQQASELAGTFPFRLAAARTTADAAATEFAVLGDTTRLNSALELRNSVNNLQRLAGLTLVTFGILGVLASLWGRWSSGNTEVW
jgi:hypothetical protein